MLQRILQLNYLPELAATLFSNDVYFADYGYWRSKQNCFCSEFVIFLTIQ